MMKEKASVKIQYRFEKCPSEGDSPLAALAREAAGIVDAAPMSIPDTCFGFASRMVSGVPMRAPAEAGATSQGQGERLRLKSIESEGGVLLVNTYDSNGRLAEVTYPDREAVRYRYDPHGRLLAVTCNNRTRIAYRYGGAGHILEASFGPEPCQVYSYTHSAEGRLTRMSWQEGWISWEWKGSRVVLLSTNDGVGVAFTPAEERRAPTVCTNLGSGQSSFFEVTAGTFPAAHRSVGKKGETLTASAFGLMKCDTSGRVLSWVRFDGEMMQLTYDQQGRIASVRSRAGGVDLDYAANGFRSALDAGGRRHLLWQTGKENQHLLMDPSGATLVRLAHEGRVEAMVGSWGNWTGYGYGLFGKSLGPKTISSHHWGKMTTAYGSGDRICSVTLAGKGSVGIKYGRDGSLAVVKLNGGQTSHICEVLRTAGLLYCLRSAGSDAFVDAFKWAHILG